MSIQKHEVWKQRVEELRTTDTQVLMSSRLCASRSRARDPPPPYRKSPDGLPETALQFFEVRMQSARLAPSAGMTGWGRD